MGWLAFNFECESPEGREALVSWFEDHHEVERREPQSTVGRGLQESLAGEDGDGDGSASPEFVADLVLSTGDGAGEDGATEDGATDGGEIEGELAWVDRYVYLTVTEEPGPLIEQTASHWDRAVRASLDVTTAGCPAAYLYSSVGSHAVEVARHQGEPGNAAIDVMYVFAMAHQFRFRAYADILPVICTFPFPSAYDVSDQTDPEDETVQELAESTGVEPTREGARFVRRDPLRPEDERPAVTPRERLTAAVRSQVVRPLRTVAIALKGQFQA